MHIETYGDGPETVLAIHGWGGDHREFAAVASRLPAGARLLSVDLPGYGRSPRPPAWDLGLIFAEFRAAVRAAAGDAPVTLAAFCSGAVLALLFAQAEPARIRRMVLIDPFAFVPWYFRLFLDGPFGRRAYMTAFASERGRRITTAVLRRMQSDDADFTAAFERIDHEVTLAYLGLFNRFGDLRRFAGFRFPIDVAVGERTLGAVRRSVRVFRRLWPQARVTTLRHVGHLPMVKGAAQLRRLVFGGAESG
jgi:pimeloyl-ACP methyl ester carboxylesterase